MNAYLQMLNAKQMTLIMSLPRNDAALCKKAFEAGADVVKVHCNVQHRASSQGFGRFDTYRDTFVQMLEEAQGPMGLVPGADLEAVLADMEAASALPFDFFSLYVQHIPPTILAAPQAIMAACGHGYAVSEIPLLMASGIHAIEASIIPAEGYGMPLSLQDIIDYRAICDASSLPVTVPTQRRILPADLPYLRDAGVRALMIGAIVTGTEDDTILDAIKRYRTAIDAL